MTDKLGAYINKLMAVVIDKEQEEFVRNLAFDELSGLKKDVESFLLKNQLSDKQEDENYAKTVKQLLLDSKEAENDENK